MEEKEDLLARFRKIQAAMEQLVGEEKSCSSKDKAGNSVDMMLSTQPLEIEIDELEDILKHMNIKIPPYIKGDKENRKEEEEEGSREGPAAAHEKPQVEGDVVGMEKGLQSVCEVEDDRSSGHEGKSRDFRGSSVDQQRKNLYESSSEPFYYQVPVDPSPQHVLHPGLYLVVPQTEMLAHNLSLYRHPRRRAGEGGGKPPFSRPRYNRRAESRERRDWKGPGRFHKKPGMRKEPPVIFQVKPLKRETIPDIDPQISFTKLGGPEDHPRGSLGQDYLDLAEMLSEVLGNSEMEALFRDVVDGLTSEKTSSGQWDSLLSNLQEPMLPVDSVETKRQEKWVKYYLEGFDVKSYVQRVPRPREVFSARAGGSLGWNITGIEFIRHRYPNLSVWTALSSAKNKSLFETCMYLDGIETPVNGYPPNLERRLVDEKLIQEIAYILHWKEIDDYVSSVEKISEESWTEESARCYEGAEQQRTGIFNPIKVLSRFLRQYKRN